MLIQADLSQIEIVLAAHLCQDQHMIKLLQDGVDLHRYSASQVLSKPEDEVTDSERKAAKRVNFGIIYGNGPKTASENSGRSEDWCKDYITKFYALFPELKGWHKKLVEQVIKTGRITMFTGQVLKFRKYPAKYEWQKRRGIKESYNPPDIKNHPVQHTAFLITSMFLGMFFREKAIYKRDKYLMIGTVHDSLMLDCKPEYVEEAKKDLLCIVDRIPKMIHTYWQETITVPVKIDISVGASWGEIEENK